MTEKSIAYFRQRAQYHLAKAAVAEQGIASIHRRFAALYAEKALKLDPSRPAQRSASRPYGFTAAIRV